MGSTTRTQDTSQQAANTLLALARLYLRAWALQAPPIHETVPDKRFDI